MASNTLGKQMIIAIDGPSAAGKSTLAKLVARRMGYIHLDTGAMYRAVGWKARQLGINFADGERVIQLARDIRIDFARGEEGENHILADGEDVTVDIRGSQVGDWASRVSAIPGVRRAMVARQRQLGADGGVVAEGRDIQTVVFPHAEVKIFLTASVEERALRRFLELQLRGTATDMAEVKREIQQRDLRDANRTDSPLCAAADAHHINTDHKTIEQVVAEVLEIIQHTADASQTTIDQPVSQESPSPQISQEPPKLQASQEQQVVACIPASWLSLGGTREKSK
jgi:cytidylate kinase